MKEFIEKLIERLEEEAVEVFRGPTVNDEPCTGLIPTGDKDIYLSRVKIIVNQLAEEYNNTSTDVSTEQPEERKTITAEEVIDKLYYGLQNIFVTLDTAKSQLSDVYEGCSSDIDLLDCSKDLNKNNNGWILCSERLPEVLQWVLIQTKQGDMDVVRYIGETECWGNDFYHRIHPRMVIAWQPLPEAYKPEQQKEIPTNYYTERFNRVM